MLKVQTPPLPGFPHFHLLLLFSSFSFPSPLPLPPFPPPLLSCIPRVRVSSTEVLPLSPQSYWYRHEYDLSWSKAWTWTQAKSSCFPDWVAAAASHSFERNCVEKSWATGWEGSPVTACGLSVRSLLSPSPPEVSNRLPLWQPGAISWLKSLRNFTGLFPGPEVDLVTLGL